MRDRFLVALLKAIPPRLARHAMFVLRSNPAITDSWEYHVRPIHYYEPLPDFRAITAADVDARMNLIQGASLASAVVIGRKAVLNDSLRFPNEPVRHKVLDLIGDLALMGAPLKGHIMAWRAGHRVNAAFGLHLRKELGL